MDFEVNEEWFKNREGPARLQSINQSIKKQEELQKQLELLLKLGMIRSSQAVIVKY